MSGEHAPDELDWRSAGEKSRATRAAKIQKAFQGRQFDIVQAVHLPRGQVFQNQFGNKGRHGWIIKDRESGEQLVVGINLLRIIAERFQGVTLPDRLRRTGSPTAE